MPEGGHWPVKFLNPNAPLAASHVQDDMSGITSMNEIVGLETTIESKARNNKPTESTIMNTTTSMKAITSAAFGLDREPLTTAASVANHQTMTHDVRRKWLVPGLIGVICLMTTAVVVIAAAIMGDILSVMNDTYNVLGS
jgi:hypothetical protein